jgi:hypothetical protein
MYLRLMMAVQAETCSSAEDYERVCQSDRIINKNVSCSSTSLPAETLKGRDKPTLYIISESLQKHCVGHRPLSEEDLTHKTFRELALLPSLGDWLSWYIFFGIINDNGRDRTRDLSNTGLIRWPPDHPGGGAYSFQWVCGSLFGKHWYRQ